MFVSDFNTPVLLISLVLTKLLVQLAICATLYHCLTRLPEGQRRLRASLVWLLAVPGFDLIWNFFVYPRIALSYQDFFRANGRVDGNDCGYALGLCCAVATLATLFTPWILLAEVILIGAFVLKTRTLRLQLSEVGADVFA